MKRTNYFLLILAFLAGSIITGSLIGVVTYANRSDAPPLAPPNPIDVPTAHAYCKAYSDTAKAYNRVLKGYFISMDAFIAMNTIPHDNLIGFRLYYGSNKGLLGIIVGVNNAGDATGSGIGMVNLPNPGLCPPTCDNTSPIQH